MKSVTFAIALLVGGAVSVAAPPDPPVHVEMKLERLNRTYSDFVPPLAGMDEGGVVVKLTSPRQTLILRDHTIRLTPLENGTIDAEIDLEIQGKGSLVADVALGPVAQQFPDEVVVPPQTISLAGNIRISRVAGGYSVTANSLPDSVRVAVQSQKVNQILALCDNAAVMTLGAIDCRGLDKALTRPELPIPSGQSFVLQDADLTDENRRELDTLVTP
ncbi:MAG: hypothetical protein AB7G12_06670 [Thermoanaerobaculia bacterium]